MFYNRIPRVLFAVAIACFLTESLSPISDLLAADSKITELPATTTPLSTDLVCIVTDPAGTPTSKKVTVGNIAKAIVGGAANSVQFNNAGVFGGFGSWDGSTLTVPQIN